MTQTLKDPRTGRERFMVAATDALGIDDAISAAQVAAPWWANLTTGERSRKLLHLATVVEQAAEEYVRAEQAGTGKPETEARGEVEQCVDLIRFFAGAVRTDLTPGSGARLRGRESWVRWEPLGIVAAIVPWNYPLLMATWRFAPALAAGNTVLLKPAETTPESALLLGRHAQEALGDGVLQTVPGDRDTGRLVAAHSGVDGIAFTGSRAGGLDVLRKAGLRRVSLELGGNCPVLVLPDAPAHTYEKLVAAVTYNAGQSCASPARVLTLGESYGRTVDGLSEAMAAKRAGKDFGPLNNPDQAARFDGIIGSSAAGIRYSGELDVAANEEGGYWRPGVILADVPEKDPAVTEEIFGPALTVQAFDTLEELLSAANGVPHALAASVWGEASAPALRLARALNAGEVWVNCHLEQTAELPHGGRKGSGHGTDMSVLALTEYQRPKTIMVDVTS
ncbi:aldehyde dehydrogenase family protein [Streptomyces sp. BG9H]|uniref:Aldehyde dehydrogenase family protein n=1 Tax=Streptomyces anatolicus TaxID=2675858 RepID=A0ABS6YI16_9ACTN|nr:aldehyde dehydrogenase family protein [Streptomyces anatolicus]MBW5420221.1 aldehyde dehydrogenase family protein [Streptomyces anatolicus]